MTTELDHSREKAATSGAMLKDPSSLPNPLLLYQLATGHYISRALFVAAKFGIADVLKDGPRDCNELANDIRAHAPSLNRVMRLLASVGVFAEEESGEFSLTPLGECLRTGVPQSSRAMVMLFAGNRISESWKDLEYCVRSGEPAYRRRGVTDPFLDPLRTPEEEAIFDAAMADLTRLVVLAVASAYDFSPFATLVDVGGGNGALMIGLLRAFPALRGIVFDQPAAAERATAQLAQADVSGRCHAVGGDFFKEVPVGGDAYILKNVINSWDDERAVAILRSCHRAMGPLGRLLIVEGVRPRRTDQSPESRRVAANDVNMLVVTGGCQRSESEFISLYEAAGFKVTKMVPTAAGVSVIEGVRI
jgi:hypothetical protein